MKKIWISLLTAIILLGILPAPEAHAASRTTVQVTLPGFAVTLNGLTVSNDYSRYPLIVYKDITYFPMTYYDCRLLGLSTDWSFETGLSIDKNDTGLSQYVRDVQSAKNAKTQQAKIAAGALKVNGKVIDNSREPYPILSFRDVAYFPLTWRFAVDEFGWDYHFDMEVGLIISNPAAPFTSAGDETVYVGDYAGMTGRFDGPPDSKLFSGASVYLVEDTQGHKGAQFQLGFYNVTGEDIRILEDNFQWEYQAYLEIDGHEELVYRKAFNFYYGELPKTNFASIAFHLPYFDSHNWTDGKYWNVVVHPDGYRYQILGEDQIYTESTEGDAYRDSFFFDAPDEVWDLTE